MNTTNQKIKLVYIYLPYFVLLTIPVSESAFFQSSDTQEEGGYMKLFSNLKTKTLTCNSKKGSVMTKSFHFILAAVMAVLFSFTTSPAIAQNDDMGAIIKGIQKENDEAVSGAVKAQDETHSCDMGSLSYDKKYMSTNRNVSNDTVTCNELQALKARMPINGCKWDKKNFPHFVAAEAKLKCGQVAVAKADEAKPATVAKTDEAEKIVLDLSKPLVIEGENPLESAKKFLASFMRDVADCKGDKVSIEESKSSAKADLDDLDNMTPETKEEVIDSFDSVIGSLTPLVIRCIEEKGVRIADMERFIKNLENLPTSNSSSQFTWEKLASDNLNPELVNGKHVRVKTKDGEEFEGVAEVVGDNLVLGEGNDAKTIPITDITEIYLRKDAEVEMGDCDEAIVAARTTVGGRLFNPDSNSWLSQLQLTLYMGGSWHWGSDTSSEQGLSYDIEAQGNSQILEIEAKGFWRFSKSVSLLYGVSVSLLRIETLFRHQEANTGAFKASVGGTVGLGGIVGVNILDIISVYGGGDAILGLGYRAKFGAEWTTPWPLRLAVEGSYSMLNTQSDSAYYTAEPADFSGWGVGFKIGLPF